MSSEDSQIIENTNTVIKKSTFNGLIIGLIVLVAVAAFFAGSYTANLNSNQISAEDLENAIAKLELKILQNQLPTEKNIPPVKISADNDPIIGDPDAPITIIEFSDFQCPFCARFHIQTLPSIMEEYIDQGKVNLVFRDFPIQSIHPNALPAAVAAECANEQSKFKEMHDVLFEKQNEWNRQETSVAVSQFIQYAIELEMEEEIFESCISSGKHIDEIRKDLEDGKRLWNNWNSRILVGNEEIGFIELKGAQPFDSFKKVIDVQLDV